MDNIGLIILIMFILLSGCAALFFFGGFYRPGYRDNLGSMVAAQRESALSNDRRNAALIDNVAAVKSSNSRLTLEKRLKYAQWKLTPAAFRLSEIVISITAFFLVGIKFNVFMQVFALAAGPTVMNFILNYAVEKRFKAFDTDYSPFILSLVGLLKTGMNVMSALEAAAEGLEEGSLVRQEVELMMERLRFGVSEDKSIGAFGEDIFHPEIELFVQALLLSRRVGGTLSDTLDRLSRQVRRRQYFRKAAHAAVGMQRGSIWFIIAILAALEGYLYVINPEFVVGAWADPIGWQVWQVGLILMMVGIFWVRQVTKLKV